MNIGRVSFFILFLYAWSVWSVHILDTLRGSLVLQNTKGFWKYCLIISFMQMLYFWPHNKFEELDNCYLVGGGTHPGSGLPTIYESGRIAANLISIQHSVPFESKNQQI
jgi:hypothetical protein